MRWLSLIKRKLFVGQTGALKLIALKKTDDAMAPVNNFTMKVMPNIILRFSSLGEDRSSNLFS